jgi:hypothetical protein
MTKDTNIPDVLWIHHQEDDGYVGENFDGARQYHEHYPTSYTRTELYAAVIAERDALRAVVVEMKAALKECGVYPSGITYHDPALVAKALAAAERAGV